jgi:Ca2+:H+ antiporter
MAEVEEDCVEAGRRHPGTLAAVARRLLWASLAMVPATILADFVFHVGKVALFVLSALALVPLAWLIGDATEHAAAHTGARIGGFLNASFGNAPELIISLIAVADRLPNVVRGSLAGSVVSNILLVLGAAFLCKHEAALDRTSLWRQLLLVFIATLVLLVPSIPGWSGDPDRHSLAILGIAPAIGLLVLYLIGTTRRLRGTAPEQDDRTTGGWTLKTSLIALGVTTAATAVISEIFVHSLEAFADAAGLSEFFIAFVVVAIVGNAAEHGGAVVIASRGNMPLASEIAISSSAQVAVLLVPVIALLSFLFAHPLTLSFRPWEIGAMAAAAAFVALVIRDGRSHRWEGGLLVGVYLALAIGFAFLPDR